MQCHEGQESWDRIGKGGAHRENIQDEKLEGKKCLPKMKKNNSQQNRLNQNGEIKQKINFTRIEMAHKICSILFQIGST